MSELNTKEISHEIRIKNRESFFSDGVLYVESFDENGLTLSTVRGGMFVEGKNLKIEGFCKEDGTIHICGEILGFYYVEESRTKKKFLERFFK